jgi:serine/threonine-protein phosphatase 2B catalytic subunit
VVKHQEEERDNALQKAAEDANNDKKLQQLSRRLSTDRKNRAPTS